MLDAIQHLGLHAPVGLVRGQRPPLVFAAGAELVGAAAVGRQRARSPRAGSARAASRTRPGTSPRPGGPGCAASSRPTTGRTTGCPRGRTRTRARAPGSAPRTEMHPDVLRHARARPGRRQQMPRMHRSIDTPARDARYSAWITRVVHQRVHLGEDAGPACPRWASAGLLLDLRQHGVGQAGGGHRQLAVARLLREPGQRVEQLGDVLADLPVGGEQAEIGVEAGGAGVVVAGAPGGRSGAGRSPSRRTTSTTLAWVFMRGVAVEDVGPGVLQRPRPQRCCSPRRSGPSARCETATCLPFSAARTSARTASALEPAR